MVKSALHMENINITSFIKWIFSSDSFQYRSHSNAEILLQLIFQNLAGYFTDDSADYLAHEPILNTIMHKKRLASQPTISRFWNRQGNSSLIDLDSALKFMRKKAYAIHQPTEVILDVATTMLWSLTCWRNLRISASASCILPLPTKGCSGCFWQRYIQLQAS